MKSSTLFAVAVLGALLPAAAAAHEIEANRATLVLRDRTHISLTLFISLDEALHQALAPRHSFEEFLLAYSAMNPADFQRALLRAQEKFEASTRLYLAPGEELPLKNWVWPEARLVQAGLQKRTMQAIAGSGGHSHSEPVEIRADATHGSEIASVQVRFPREFQKLLVVAFRPTQLWVESSALSPSIQF